MVDSRLVRTISQEVGSGPALAWYFEKMKLQATIDRQIPGHPNRTELSHGQAVVALVTMILNHSHALYHMEEWAQRSRILSQVLPGIAASAYTDDRLGDTLDALFAADLDHIQSQVSLSICKAFEIPVEFIHSDTTSFSFYGAYEQPPDAPSPGVAQSTGPELTTLPGAAVRPSIPCITYGHSKQHRPDLKQMVLSLSVTEQQLPLFGSVLDGNTEDSTTYLKQWMAVSQILSRSDFLFLGDSKLATRKNLRQIIDHQGVFLSAAALTPKLKRWLVKQLEKGALPLKPFATIDGQVTPADVHGYTYAQRWIKIGPGRKYRIRQLILRSEKLAQRHEAKRQKQVTAFQQGLQLLNEKLNQYKLKTPAQIQKAVDKLGRKYPLAQALVAVTITKKRETHRRLHGPGRPGKNRKYRTKQVTRYALASQVDKQALKRARRLDGIFIRVTNASENRLPDSLALVTYKKQWKVERQNRILKGPIALTPVFLQKPQRIAALTIVCLIAVQVLRLMERQAQQTLCEQQEKIVGLYPNKIATDHPPALRMIDALSSIQVIKLEHKNKPTEYYVTNLTPLQRKVLLILRVPAQCYSPKQVLKKFHKTREPAVET